MSENQQQPGLTVGRVELPETITVAEQARAAGRQDIRPPGADDIDAFRTQCFGFINGQSGSSEALAMAKTKADEMVFWLRRARERAHA